MVLIIDTIINWFKLILGIFTDIISLSIELLNFLPQIISFTGDILITFFTHVPLVIGLYELWIVSSAIQQKGIADTLGVIIEKNGQMIKGIYNFIFLIYHTIINIMNAVSHAIASLPIF